jgi:glyoxylase-like metal-dependent hydrolase (beta-lactamase superfamily II)
MPELHRLDKGVYGVTNLTMPFPGIGVNAGFITTSSKIINIDSGLTINDGTYLLNTARNKANHQKEIQLILTHHHSDHIFGMRVFREARAKVLAHKNLHRFLSHRQLPLFRTSYATYKPFIIKMMTKRQLCTREKAESILGDVKLSPPDEMFNEDTALKLNDDNLSLLYTPGHVPSEISVYHQESKTLFAGDAIYQGMPLTTKFGGHKEWRQWIESLEKLERLDIKNIVPGHGKICAKDEIRRNITYLEGILSR